MHILPLDEITCSVFPTQKLACFLFDTYTLMLPNQLFKTPYFNDFEVFVPISLYENR